MKLVKAVGIFVGIGTAISAVVAGLATIAPSVFGWLTTPMWVLPALFGGGAHDFGWPLFAVSGVVVYGAAAFVASRWWQRRTAHKLR